MEFLCQYDFEVKYIQGKENVIVDALSRKRHEISTLTLSVDLWSHILQALPTNTWYQEVSSKIYSDMPLEEKNLGYVFESDGLLCHTRRIYVYHH